MLIEKAPGDLSTGVLYPDVEPVTERRKDV
jgi:hypothetical protein